MKYNIDIDAGGVFTSGFLWGEGRLDWVKVETTPDDLTIGFSNCINELAEKCNVTPGELLKETGTIRLSSTLGTLLTRMSGPKLGLIVTSGYEKNLYATQEPHDNVLDILISPDMVVGIDGSIDASGKINQELNKDEVRKGIKQLLVQGARFIVVSLFNSSLNAALEEQVREIVEIDYPKHFLGSVPVMLSTEISLTRDNAYRTKAALLEAFIHRQMTRYFYKTDEDLRNEGYQRHLLIIHNSGGAARTAKTKAINTIGASQTATLYGAHHLSKLYGLPDIVTIDAGGTSTAIGLIINGTCSAQEESEIHGLPVVRLPLLETIVPGVGGNSVVSLSKKTKELLVGPDTVDNKRGPSCYVTGNSEPAVIDACLVLGYINPDFFMAGKKKLDTGKAHDIIDRKIAGPLGINVEQAAGQIIGATVSEVCDALKQLYVEKGITGDKIALLSCGGIGGLIYDGICKEMKIDRTYIAPFAAHFSVFGSSTIDVIHEYESTAMTVIRTSSGESLFPVDRLNEIVKGLIESGTRDMRGEGFTPDTIKYNLEVELRYTGPGIITRVPFPRLYFKNREDIELLIKEMENAHPPGKSSVNDEIVVEVIRLKAICTLPYPELPACEHAGPDPKGALKGYREVHWNGGPLNSPVYDHQKLKCGNIVTGPAIIESPYTSILVPGDKQYSVDTFSFGLIEPAARK